MAAVGVGSKYNVALNGVGYLLRGLNYRKRDLPALAPRFSTGEQGDTDLDAWKTISQRDFSGGGFSATPDEASVALVGGLTLNQEALVYPPPVFLAKTMPTTSTPSWHSMAGPTALYRDVLYTSGYISTAHSVWKYNESTGAFDDSKVNFAAGITGMAVFDDKLFVTMASGYMWKLDGTTWSQFGSGNSFRKLCTFNDKLYCATSTSGGQGQLYSHNGTTPTLIGSVGGKDDPILNMVSYNHRLWIGKEDGLFTYDGVAVSCVIDYSSNVSTTNFNYMAVYNGLLYFNIGKSLYSFNGSTVELIRTFSNPIAAMATAGDRLYIALSIDRASKGMIYIGGTPTGSELYAYDGVGMFLIHTSTSNGHYQVITYANGALWYIKGNPNVEGSSWYGYRAVLGTEYAAYNTTRTITIVSPNYDCGFFAVDKCLESISVYADALCEGDTIVVTGQIYNGVSWSSTDLAFGTITYGGSNTLYLRDVPTISPSFKKIRFKFVLNLAANSTATFAGYSFKYCLVPTYKREWQLSLLTVGTSESPQTLLDGSEETKYANALRENVYDARASVVPVGFEDVDYTRASGAITTTATTINVDDTNTFAESGFIKIDDEIIKYTGKTATSFTGCTRASLGTTAATHADDVIVNSYYRVIVAEIANEEVYPPAEGPISPAINYNESITTVTLKEA